VRGIADDRRCSRGEECSSTTPQHSTRLRGRSRARSSTAGLAWSRPQKQKLARIIERSLSAYQFHFHFQLADFGSKPSLQACDVLSTTQGAAPVADLIHSFMYVCWMHVSASLSWMRHPPSLWERKRSRCPHLAPRPSSPRAPCMSVPPLNASYAVCSVLRVHGSAISSSKIIVYCVLCVLCLVRARQSAVPLLSPPRYNTRPWHRGWAASSCTPGATAFAQAPRQDSTSSSSWMR